MAVRKISDASGLAALAAALATPTDVDRDTLATAVRYSLQLVAARHPGKTLELRVPPFGAVQCVAGPAHTRGTPPNVVEADPATWVALATGTLGWAEAVSAARVQASGTRADLSGLLPVVPLHLD
ncbi:MAG TPA: sterol carrier family protein [Candidatus Lumbricidophila sp.]|nr:sterol carrier family protein [Candidatus Lumbricidophila sp.]